MAQRIVHVVDPRYQGFCHCLCTWSNQPQKENMAVAIVVKHATYLNVGIDVAMTMHEIQIPSVLSDEADSSAMTEAAHPPTHFIYLHQTTTPQTWWLRVINETTPMTAGRP